MTLFIRKVFSARGGSWIDWVCAAGAVAGLLAAVWWGLKVQSWQGGASDFKTLYASSWCFAHNYDAYKVKDIEGVFEANGVVLPALWDGHRAVYPPFTLPLMVPMTLLPMVSAAYVWMGLSAMFVVWGVVILCMVARDFFGLPVGWRMAVIALCAAGPLLSFGLELANGSLVVTTLCFAAALAPSRLSTWQAATALAIAILLKPHLAVWMLIALLVSGDAVREKGSAVALRAIALCAGVAAATAAWLASQHMLGAQIDSYRTILWAETHRGSMSPAARDPLGIPEQITSLQSTLGYWWPNAYQRNVLSIVFCCLIAAILVWVGARMRWQGASAAQKVLYLGCWTGLGMIATYHRAHDAILLLVLAPWVIARLHRWLLDPAAWGVMGGYAAMSLGPTREQLDQFAGWSHLKELSLVIYYRQVPLATLLLELLLVYLMCRSMISTDSKADEIAVDEASEMAMYSEV